MGKDNDDFGFLDDLFSSEGIRGSEDSRSDSKDKREEEQVEAFEEEVNDGGVSLPSPPGDQVDLPSSSESGADIGDDLPNMEVDINASETEDIETQGDSDVPGIIVDDDDFTSDFLDEEALNEDDELSNLSPRLKAALEWEPPPPKSTEDTLINEWIQTGWIGELHLDQILTEAIIVGASDVHITANLKVSMTRNGDIVKYDGYVTPDEEVMHVVIHDGILGYQDQQVLNQEYEYEGAYTLMFGPMAGRRTRLTIGRTFGQYFMVFRIINEHIPTLEELGVDNEIVSWSHYPNGLFLICGPTGSGKSTTLASIVRNLQMTTQKKIITIEKPIEYIYPDDGPSLVVQREVGGDTRGFYSGLTSAMRQSPNVILLGEVRNNEEVSELLRAAETGHLAISTMHTNSVATTINRIRNLFEGNEQKRIMSTLADTMRGVGNQVLVKTTDGKGRFAVNELLTVNDEIRKLITEGDVRGIRDYQIERKATMEHNLARAVKAGKCLAEDARGQAAFPDLFEELIASDDWE